jgi:hypothetical protein
MGVGDGVGLGSNVVVVGLGWAGTVKVPPQLISRRVTSITSDETTFRKSLRTAASAKYLPIKVSLTRFDICSLIDTCKTYLLALQMSTLKSYILITVFHVLH